MKNQSWKPLWVIFGLSGIFFIIFVTATFVFFTKNFGGGGDARAKLGGDAVGLVELKGVIMDSKKVLKTLEKFEESDDIKAIVLRINSPGGAVAPSQEIYQAVKKSSKPIVSSLSSVAASGGYYVAVGTKKIFANPGTITGSIGVIMEFANLEKLYDWAKIKRYSIKTGKFKDVGSDHRDMQPEERALLQAMVDDVLLQFKTAVSEGRKLSMDEVTALADGRIFSGSQAKAARLVDELGTLDDTIAEAGKMAGITGKPRVVTDERKRDFWTLIEGLQGDPESEESSLSEGSWLDRLVGAVAQRITGVSAVRVLEPGIYWLWHRGA